MTGMEGREIGRIVALSAGYVLTLTSGRTVACPTLAGLATAVRREVPAALKAPEPSPPEHGAHPDLSLLAEVFNLARILGGVQTGEIPTGQLDARLHEYAPHVAEMPWAQQAIEQALMAAQSTSLAEHPEFRLVGEHGEDLSGNDFPDTPLDDDEPDAEPERVVTVDPPAEPEVTRKARPHRTAQA